MGVIHIVNDREAHDNPGCSLSLQQAFFRSGTRLETTCGILETNRETPQVFLGDMNMGYLIILNNMFTYVMIAMGFLDFHLMNISYDLICTHGI